MRVKKAGGKVFGAVLTATERKAMEMEINRQIAEADRRYADDIDAMVLYTLHGSSMTLSPPSMTALSSIIKCRTITHGSARRC